MSILKGSRPTLAYLLLLIHEQSSSKDDWIIIYVKMHFTTNISYEQLNNLHNNYYEEHVLVGLFNCYLYWQVVLAAEFSANPFFQRTFSNQRSKETWAGYEIDSFQIHKKMSVTYGCFLQLSRAQLLDVNQYLAKFICHTSISLLKNFCNFE